MSLLERLGRGHLSDQQFARLWTSQEPHPHLDACAECRARFADFDGWLLGVGETLRAEADEAFPAERLAVQQAQIARRLETLARTLLGIQLLHLVIGFVASRTKSQVQQLDIDWSFSLTPWIAVLLLFVLARVFEQGARMRADLEGTV